MDHIDIIHLLQAHTTPYSFQTGAGAEGQGFHLCHKLGHMES